MINKELLERLAQKEKDFLASFVNPQTGQTVVEIEGIKVKLVHVLKLLKGRVSREKLLGTYDKLKAGVRTPNRPSERVKLLLENPHCTYCGRELTEDNSSIDHKIPRCRGGSNKKSNFVLACKQCNNIKGTMLPEKWEKVFPILQMDGYFKMSKKQRIAWRKKNPGLLPYGVR